MVYKKQLHVIIIDSPTIGSCQFRTKETYAVDYCGSFRQICERDEEKIEKSSQESKYSTVRCSTVQYSTVQYSTVQYSTVRCSVVQ